VIANDLSPSATMAMTRNVELNSLGAAAGDGNSPGGAAAGDGNSLGTAETGRQGKVRVNQGDAR